VKIAYLVLAHKNPRQLARLISQLKTDDSTFIIHIDKKSNLNDFKKVLNSIPDCKIYYTKKRVRVIYPNYPILNATIKSINELFINNIEFDYLFNISGQDYPIKSKKEILCQLQKYKGSSFINYHEIRDPEKNGWGAYRYNQYHFVRSNIGLVKIFQKILNKFSAPRTLPDGLTPFGGSALWCLHNSAVKYIYEYICKRRHVINFFKTVAMPDEMFIHTVLLNSALQNNIINFGISYSEWPGKSTHSITLTSSDLPKLLSSPKWFARKFDLSIDNLVLDKLDEIIKNSNI